MHRRKHKPYVFIVLAVIAAVGFMTWQDMQKIADKNIARLKLAQYVYAADDPQAIPANRLPLYLEAGTIVTDAETGEAGFTPAIAPQTVAQREINLITKIDHVPASMTGAGAHLTTLAADWKAQNNILNELVLDWQVETPDFEKMPVFATMIAETMNNAQWIGMILQRSWFDQTPEAALDMARRTRAVTSYIFDIDEAARDGETLADTVAALNKLNISFLLIVDTLPERGALSDLSGANDFFNGFILHERLPAR